MRINLAEVLYWLVQIAAIFLYFQFGNYFFIALWVVAVLIKPLYLIIERLECLCVGFKMLFEYIDSVEMEKEQKEEK